MLISDRIRDLGAPLSRSRCLRSPVIARDRMSIHDQLNHEFLSTRVISLWYISLQAEFRCIYFNDDLGILGKPNTQ